MRILRSAQVVERTGLSRTTIWRLEKNNAFPRRVPLTENTTGWLSHEIDEWIADRAAARHGDAAGQPIKGEVGAK